MKQNVNIVVKRPVRMLEPDDEGHELQLDPGAGYRGGQLFFANDSRFNETYFVERATQYGVGFADHSPLQQTLDFVAPAVRVGRRFEWKKASNAEAFLSETFDDERAIGSDFKRVEYTAQDVQDKTVNKGLTYVVDLDNVTGDDWQNEKAARLIRRLLRNELRRAVAVLSGAATNTNKTWNSSADPDGEVLSEIEAGADLIGLTPNRVLYGRAAWIKRVTAYRAQNNAGGYASAALTPGQVADFLSVDGVQISRERYQSSSTAKSQVVNNKVLLYYAEADPDTEDGSVIKRFWTPCVGGERLRVYVQQLAAKLVALTVEHYSKVVVTHNQGIRQFTVS